MFRTAIPLLLALAVTVGAIPDVASAADPAPAPSAATTHLQQVLVGMGYSPTLHGTTEIHFTTQRNYFICATADNAGAFFWVSLPPWPAGSEGKIPFLKALAYNDTGNMYFSSRHFSDGENIFALNYYIPGSPAAADLLKAIPLMEANADKTREIWDPDQWK